jgi:tetratricopeptide (TPR) repeat protein
LIMMDGGRLSPYSANCFSVYGLAELGLGNIDQGVRYGELAMKLIHRIPCPEAECHTMIGIITLLHWKTPIRSLECVMANALNKSFEVGDVIYGSLCFSSHSALRYILGENLGSLEQSMRAFHGKLCDLGQDAMIRWFQPCLQYVLIMRAPPRMSVWEDLTFLSGEVMDESEYLKEAITLNHKMLLMMVWKYKSLLAYNFGRYEMAEMLYYAMDGILRLYRNAFLAPPYHFYGAMIFYERYRSTRRAKHLKQARKHVKSLKRFEAAGSPNVSTFVLFLEAEALSLTSGDVTALVSAYTKAINASKAERFLDREALANERLGFVLHSLGCHELANTYVIIALSLYAEWGATAKYEWLVVQQRNLHFDPSGSNTCEKC